MIGRIERLSWALLVVLTANVVIAMAQTGGFIHDDDVTIQGNLTVTGEIGLPADLVAYSSSGSCPTGWSEYTTARGRYIVGLGAGFTNEQTVGTAFTATGEDRPVGQHNHSVSESNHDHTYSTNGGSNAVLGAGAPINNTSATTGGSTTGLTIDNAGAVAGTNAPYVQLMACKKD